MNPKNVTKLLHPHRALMPVAVLLSERDGPVAQRLPDLAEALHWKLVNLEKYGNTPPPGLSVQGALVDVLPTHPVVVSLLSRDIPVVRIGRLPHPDDHRVPAVMTDRRAIGRLAAEHFAAKDFKHLAYYGRDPLRGSQTLYEAFAQRAEQLGCACHLERMNEQNLRAQVTPDRDWWMLRQQHFTRWINTLPKPVGLLGYSDGAADLYCQWTIEAGLRIPEDVAVLGIDNNRFVCMSAAVQISSIPLNDEAVVRTAGKMLTQLMQGQPLEETTVQLPPLGVVTRQSTDVLAASDPFVVDALRFIRDNVERSLSVDQIASHVGASRRTLERGFKRELGRGINQELQRRRLEKARQLLDQTDMQIGQISSMLCFESRHYFTRFFRRSFGCTPRAYRQRSQPQSTAVA